MKWEKPKHWLRQKKTKAVIASTALVFALLAAQPDISVADMYVRDHEIRKVSEPVCSIVCLPAGMGLIKPSSSSASIITSVQDFSCSVSSSSATGDATITSVTTSRAHCVWGGQTFSAVSTNATNYKFYVQLTSSTNVRATRGTASANTAVVVGSVIEYTTAAISNMQQGTMALTASAATVTATITSVTTTNSAVFNLGSIALSSGTFSDYMFRVELTAATTVTGTRSSSSTDDETIGYVVCSFNTGILNSSTQAFTCTLTAASSNTAAVSAVTLAQTMTAYGAETNTAGVSVFDRLSWGQLTSTTVYTVSRTSSSQNVIHAGTLIEFKAANINGVDRGTLTIATSATTADATIGAISASLTATTQLGWGNNLAAGETTNAAICHVARTSTTNVRATRNSSSASSTSTLGYEVVEFK